MKAFLLLAAVAALSCLTNCVTKDSTDHELAFAQASMEAASLTYDLARISYTARAADPSVSAAEKLIAQRAFETAQRRLEEESAKVAAIIASRKAEALALPTGPPDTTPVLLGERTAVK